MKYLSFLLIMIFGCSQNVFSQELIKPADYNFPFDVEILKLKLERERSDLQSVISLFDENNFIYKEDSLKIELRAAKGTVPDFKKVNALGGNIKHTFKNYAVGFIHIEDLLSLDEIIATTNYIKILPNIDSQTDNEGPGLVNSDSYNNIGTAGTGIKIAIIDNGYGEYDLTLTNTPGCLPDPYTYYDCTSGTCIELPEDTGTKTHGRGCTQLVYDHAPAADYFLYKVGTNAEKAAAIEHADALDVDIISMSLSSYNTGWDDDSGVVCDAATDVLSNDDMLIFVSAGNRNGTHYQSVWIDDDNDDRFDYSPGDETNLVTLANNRAIGVSLQWEGEPTASNDLDLIIFDNSTGIILDSGTNSSDFEYAYWNNTTGSAVTVGVRILNEGTTTPEFEYWNSSSTTTLFEHASTSNSTTSPANSTHPNVYAVSAIQKDSYGLDGAVTIAAASKGPTNEGNTSVAITAPTGCVVAKSDGDPNNFGFTSGSAPNAAGAAAAFWSRHSSLTANDVREIINAKAAIYLDVGDPGFDHDTGYGAIQLFDYNSKNVYVDRFNGTNGVAPANLIFPWDNVKDVDTFAPVDRIVFFLTNDTNSDGALLNKEMLLTTGGVGGKVID